MEWKFDRTEIKGGYNFQFAHNRTIYIRQSFKAIKEIAKELRLTVVIISCDKWYWSSRNHLFKNYSYKPKY